MWTLDTIKKIEKGKVDARIEQSNKVFYTDVPRPHLLIKCPADLLKKVDDLVVNHGPGHDSGRIYCVEPNPNRRTVIENDIVTVMSTYDLYEKG